VSPPYVAVIECLPDVVKAVDSIPLPPLKGAAPNDWAPSKN